MRPITAYEGLMVCVGSYFCLIACKVGVMGEIYGIREIIGY